MNPKTIRIGRHVYFRESTDSEYYRNSNGTSSVERVHIKSFPVRIIQDAREREQRENAILDN